MKTKTKTGQVLFAALASTALVFGTAVPAFAAWEDDSITAGGAKDQSIEYAPAVENSGDTQYWLQISEDGWDDPDKPGGLGNMSVDVPIKVKLAVDAEGNFVTPTALKNVVENKSEFPLDVTGISIESKDGFTLATASGFDANTTSNIYRGTIASAALNAARTAVDSSKQTLAFTRLGEFASNSAWRMEANDSNDKYGTDCLFIQIDGELGNISGKYFTKAINVFDITYTFAAASADAGSIGTATLAD